MERLQKAIAHAGVTSRRKAEEINCQRPRKSQWPSGQRIRNASK
ncbi:hypothetical protein HMPREF9520_02708 [Enterococcus faecalis TX1467]|nr:hypothetical protein HMPREF9520_02708 [Enterococcus faecalis TX1467]